MVKDPVCGMQIDATKTAYHTIYQGQPFHFCSAVCKGVFDREPPRYIVAPASNGETNSQQ